MTIDQTASRLIIVSPIYHSNLLIFQAADTVGLEDYLVFHLLEILREEYEVKYKLRDFIAKLHKLDSIEYNLDNEIIKPRAIAQIDHLFRELYLYTRSTGVYEKGNLPFNAAYMDKPDLIVLYSSKDSPGVIYV